MEIKQMIKCPGCDGTKTQTIVAQMLTSKGWEKQPPVIIPCIRCDGTGEVDAAEQEALEKLQEEFWCRCDDKSDTRYVDDHKDERCDKHHWRCNVCDKVVQVG